MFLKLCKMEMKYSWRSFSLMYALLLICSLVIDGNGASSGSWSVLQGFLIMFYMAIIFSIVILVIVNVVRNYARSMFGRESYLTHTLPVNSTQLLLSKTLVGLMWILLSGCVILLSVLIFAFRTIGDFPSFSDWMYLFQNLDIFHIEVLASFLSMLFSYSQVMLQVFFIMTLVHSCYIRRHRVAWGVGIYFLISFIQSFLSVQILRQPVSGFTISLFSTNYVTGISSLGSAMWLSLAVSIGLCSLYFLATTYLIDHKLEVE